MKTFAIVAIALAVSGLILYILNAQGVFNGKNGNGNGTTLEDLEDLSESKPTTGKPFTL